MPPPHSFDYAVIDADLKVRPSIVTWSRLEPLSMTTGDLLPGLRALIGDPLWMLARQWQFEELRGEDGGSPIRVEVDGEHARLGRFHPGRVDANGTPADSAVDIAGAKHCPRSGFQLCLNFRASNPLRSGRVRRRAAGLAGLSNGGMAC